MTWRIIVGTLSMVLTLIMLGYVAVTEQDRMALFETGYNARQIETGAALYETNCASCHGPTGGGGAGPALNTPDLVPPPDSNVLPPRLAEIGYAGSAEDYIRGTIAAGRPRPTLGMEQYTGGLTGAIRMPTWSQRFGGPLRDDQIEALVAFVMNWGAAFEPGAVTTPVVGVGTDISVELPEGDAGRGEALANSQGCTGCHVTSTTGPAWLASADPSGQGIGTRAELRIAEAGYTGAATTGDQYLFESIVQPAAYLVPPFQDLMPKVYGNNLDAQMVADLIAYLQTLE